MDWELIRRLAGKYDVAEICLNGHIITTTAIGRPERRLPFCRDCGTETVHECASCHRPIQGSYWSDSAADPYPVDDVKPRGTVVAPAFCHGCGTAYPWTQAKVRALHDLAMELEGLEPNERESLVASFPDLIADKPQTPVAASQVKRLLGKAGQGAGSLIGKLVIDLVTEAAKKIIFSQ